MYKPILIHRLRTPGILKSILTACIIIQSGVSLSQNVNEFTGSFSYNIPLLQVPSEKGEGVSIGAGYSSGIAVKQPASEIGLGWFLSAGGSISRSVSGLADDCYGCNVFDQKTKTFVSENGLLYGAGHTDLYHTNKNQDSTDFMFPDYDGYSIGGPGIGGTMRPYLFNYQSFTKNSSDGRYYPGTMGKTPQFHFIGDFADTLTSRHYSVTPITGSSPYNPPGTSISGCGYTSSPEPYIGKKVSGSSILQENYDPTTNRLGSANYVEYFTNAQINNISSVNIPGFIDFQTSHARSSSSFPAQGIGAFRITNPSGYVYHYSLPVYLTKNEVHNYPLENDYTVPSYNLAGYNTPTDYYTWTANTDVVTKYTSTIKYAYQWLLTAVTGPNYYDTNNNHIVDEGDEGYWVSYDYKPWCSDFASRSPHYGFDYSFGLDEDTKRLPVTQPLTGTNYKLSGKSGEVNILFREVYYLNKIKTTSHTAIFVHDLRKDEISSHTTTDYASISPVQSLKVSRILLFKNDRIDSLTTKTPFMPETEFEEEGFANTTNSSNYFYTESWFNNNLTSNIKNKLLKHIEFSQDYSLCRGYHGNYDVTAPSTSVLSPPGVVQSNIDVNNYSSSGKLTLNKITTYNYQNVKVMPGIVFDYNEEISNDNPDYNPIKTDYWGFYKSDVTTEGYSGYTTSTSKDYTDAWSLRRVIEPTGKITEIDYESNSYKKVISNTSENGYRGATFIYPITDAVESVSNSTDFDITMEETTDPSEFSGLMTSTIPGIQKKLCLAHSYHDLTNYSNIPAYLTILSYGNFSYSGSSPYTITGIENEIWNSGSNPDCFLGIYNPSHPAGWLELDPGLSFDYSGNGYLFFEYPVGEEAYGGGPRVKRIKTINGSQETYVQEYTYEDGVASAEADRFEYPELKSSCGYTDYFINKLKPMSFRHSMGPSIGYSRVTLKNLGRANTSNGSVITEFITSSKNPDYSDINNYSVNIVPKTPNSAIIKECINKFSSLWGQVKESRVLDVNNVIISKTAYEYENTEQGAMVENFFFNDIDANYDNHINIMRSYPIVPKKIKSFGMGSYSESETLRRDEITGEAILIRNTGQNGSSSLVRKVPAFRISAFANMGPKSVNPSYDNNLTQDAFSFSSVDTTLTPVTSGVGSSFVGAASVVFSKSANMLTSNGGNKAFTGQSSSQRFWRNNLSYSWSGINGSVDTYGLFKRSELTANPFNFSSPSSSSNHWRFNSETTLMDNCSHALETRSFNNRFNAVKFGYNNYHLLAKASNCNYASFTYTGFEANTPGLSNFVDGEVYLSLGAGSGTLVTESTIAPHTGYRCLATTGTGANYTGSYSNNGSYETGIQRGRMYRAIVWVSANSPSGSYLRVQVLGTVGGSFYIQGYTMAANDSKAITIGNWKRLCIEFKIPENIVSLGTNEDVAVSLIGVGGTAYFDDLILCPVESSFEGYVYNPANGYTIAQLNSLGYATYFTNDAGGRTIEERREIPGVGIKKIKSTSYNFLNAN